MVDDRINHIPKEMPGRLVPDVQVPEDWFDDIGVVDERDDARRVAAQSVQLARHAAALPANPRVVPEQFEHFQKPAPAWRLPCDKARCAGIDLQHRPRTQRQRLLTKATLPYRIDKFREVSIDRVLLHPDPANTSPARMSFININLHPTVRYRNHRHCAHIGAQTRITYRHPR